MAEILTSLHGRRVGLTKDNQLALANPATGAVVVVADPAKPVIQQTAQADSTATDVTGLKADFNTLLGKLRSAGILAAS